MFSLKDHPFAVDAFFDSSVVLTFAIPKEKLQPLIPECLELDTFQDKWGFVAVAMVQTKDLRPKGFPKFMGNDFFLTGYRVFVKYHTSEGKRLRGLYILKSETDKKKMEFLGNIFTHYNYTTTDIKKTQSDSEIVIHSQNSGLDVHIENSSANVPLPKGSPFADWKEARRYAGPLPFTFTYNKEKREVLIIEGVREDWNPAPIKINSFKIKFLDNFPDAVLANAFVINNIPYYWEKGKIDKWRP